MLFEVMLSCILVSLTIVWICGGRFYPGKRYPKGPWGVPVLGHLLFFGALPTETFRQWSEKYGDVFRIRLGSWNTVVVNGEKAIKEIVSKRDAFSGRPPLVTQHLLKEVYNGNESLIFTNFDASYILHRKHAKAALRFYTHDCENELQDLIFEESIKMIENVLQERHDVIDMFKQLDHLVFNIMYQLLYGRGKSGTKSKQMEDLLKARDGISESLKSGNVVDVLPWLKYIWPSAVANVKKNLKIYNSVWKVNMDEHKRTFDKYNMRDLADVFLATNIEDTNEIGNDNKYESTSFTHERLVRTLLDFFAAGIDTTSSALQWLFLYLIEFPEIQQRVFDEINNVIGQSRCIVWADHFKIPYTMATVNEVLRIRPVSPFGLLHYTTQDTELDNLDIDKDTVVLINFHSVSHDRNFWGDPQNFRPERYLLDNGELDPVKMKYDVTFGVGRRMCVGETLARKKLFLIFATLIQRCVFSKPESIVSNFEPVVGITYTPKPYRMIVKERI